MVACRFKVVATDSDQALMRGFGSAARAHLHRSRSILVQLHLSNMLTASCGAHIDHGALCCWIRHQRGF